MGLTTQEEQLLVGDCRNCWNRKKCSFLVVKIVFATDHAPVANLIGIVGTEIKWLNNQYVVDVELESDSHFLCDFRQCNKLWALSYSSRNALQLRSPCAFFFPFFFCFVDPAATQLNFGRLCNFLGGLTRTHSTLFVIINLLPCSKRASVFCASPLASMPLTFLEQNTCVNAFLGCRCKWVMKPAASLHHFRYLAAFCIWLLRKRKSSSWPALPFPLLPC